MIHFVAALCTILASVSGLKCKCGGSSLVMNALEEELKSLLPALADVGDLCVDTGDIVYGECEISPYMTCENSRGFSPECSTYRLLETDVSHCGASNVTVRNCIVLHPLTQFLEGHVEGVCKLKLAEKFANVLLVITEYANKAIRNSQLTLIRNFRERTRIGGKKFGRDSLKPQPCGTATVVICASRSLRRRAW